MKKIFQPVQLEIYLFEEADVFMQTSLEPAENEMPPVGIFGESNFS